MPSLLEAHLRHAKYFGNTVLKATELFQNGDKDQLTALTEIDKELPNIEIGWDWITNHASNVEVDSLLLDYGVKGVILIGSRYSARTLIQRQQLTILAARNLGRAYDEATSLANIGNAYINLGEAQKALKFYQQSMDILQKVEKTDENEHKDRIGVGNVLCSIGNAYFLLGEITEAQKWFNQSLVVTQAGNHSVGIDALIGLGIIYRLKGEILKSLSYYEQALQIIQKIGDKPAEARILSELGNVNRSVGNLDQALEFHNQALLIAHSIGYKGLEGAILGNIGTDYYMQADGHRAIDYHKLHLAITRELGNRGGEGSALGNLGLADLILGNVQSAVDYFMQHLTIAQDISDRRGEMNALRNLGMSYRALGITSKAISYMEESLLITKELDSQSAEIDLVEKLDLLYAQSSTELNFYNFYEDYKFLFSLKISPGWHRNPLDTKFIAQGGRIALTHPLGGTVNISCGHLYSRISINKDKRTKEILDFLRNLPGRTSFPRPETPKALHSGDNIASAQVSIHNSKHGLISIIHNQIEYAIQYDSTEHAIDEVKKIISSFKFSDDKDHSLFSDDVSKKKLFDVLKSPILWLVSTVLLFILQIPVVASLIIGYDGTSYLSILSSSVGNILIAMVFGLFLFYISNAVEEYTPLIPNPYYFSESQVYKEFQTITLPYHFATFMLIGDIGFFIILAIFQLIGSEPFFTSIIGQLVFLFACSAPFWGILLGHYVISGDEQGVRLLKKAKSEMISNNGKFITSLYFYSGSSFLIATGGLIGIFIVARIFIR